MAFLRRARRRFLCISRARPASGCEGALLGTRISARFTRFSLLYRIFRPTHRATPLTPRVIARLGTATRRRAQGRIDAQRYPPPLCCCWAPPLAAPALATPALAQRGWEPTRPVQFIVPAGTGGGADQMARVIQGIVSKHELMRQPMVVVNKAGGAGAEGFLEAKGARGNPHMLVITLSNLFTTPLATGVPFNWQDLTPVAMMALDEFVLWVNADSPWKTVAGIPRRGEATSG